MSVTREQVARLRTLLRDAYECNSGDGFGRFADRLAAILDAPAPEGTVEVEHEVLISESGAVATAYRGQAVHNIVPPRHNWKPSRDHAIRSHTVRVRYRVPLPPEPVVVEGEVVR